MLVFSEGQCETLVEIFGVVGLPFKQIDNAVVVSNEFGKRSFGMADIESRAIKLVNDVGSTAFFDFVKKFGG